MGIFSHSMVIFIDGDTYYDDRNRFVTTTLHKVGTVEHKAHQYCVYEMILSQLENEPEGIEPDNFNNIPFKCMLCRKKITIEQAAAAAGLTAEMLKNQIQNDRTFRQSIRAPQDQSCIIL